MEVVAMMDSQTVLAVCAIIAVVVEIIGLSRNNKWAAFRQKKNPARRAKLAG